MPMPNISGSNNRPVSAGEAPRTAPTAALFVVPRSGHTITSEEPTAVNAALAELFAATEAGRWLAHRPPA